jgi:nucleotide-binding universal stress UspA family protein
MATNFYTVNELAACVARFVASKACPYARALELVARCSVHNVRAVSENYHEPMAYENIVSAHDIEAAALSMLAAPQTWLDVLRFGSNLAYNCAECPEFVTPSADLDGLSMLDTLKPLEKHANEWFDRLENEARRKEENDRAYTEEPALPMETRDEIRARAASLSCARVIVAEFMVNESDLYTDYHGGRSVRRVVIGFGKGKRENFRELRAAAAAFPPAKHLACDRVSVYVTVPNSENAYDSRREYLKDDKRETIIFNSVDEARAAIATLQAEHTEHPNDLEKTYFSQCLKKYPAEFRIESPEHRENYSMGGGNYLGWSRYSGWSVWSTPVDCFKGTEQTEFFEAPRKIVAGKLVKPAPLPGPQEPKETPAPFPTWTTKGLLQKAAFSIEWPHTYRKEETAQKDVDRLAAMGITADIVRRRHGLAVRLVKETAPQEPAEPAKPPAPRFDVLSVL